MLDGTKVPSGEAMVARARALIPVLAGRAADGERERRISNETIADMQAAGLFKVLQPKRWGGYEQDIHTYFDVQMALGEGDMSVAWVYGVVGVHPWLSGASTTTASRGTSGATTTPTLICSSLMPTGQVTQGRRRLSASAAVGSTPAVATIAAGRFLERRSPVRSRRQTGASFWCRARDFEIVGRPGRVSGLKSTGSHDIVVEGRVRAGSTARRNTPDTFDGVAPGLAVNTAPLYRLPFGQVFFRGVSTGAIGALQGMFNPLPRIRQGARQPDVRQQGVGGSGESSSCAPRSTTAPRAMKTILHRNFRNLETYAARGESQPPIARPRRSQSPAVRAPEDARRPPAREHRRPHRSARAVRRRGTPMMIPTSRLAALVTGNASAPISCISLGNERQSTELGEAAVFGSANTATT